LSPFHAARLGNGPIYENSTGSSQLLHKRHWRWGRAGVGGGEYKPIFWLDYLKVTNDLETSCGEQGAVKSLSYQ
jgi:hypothetical protein